VPRFLQFCNVLVDLWAYFVARVQKINGNKKVGIRTEEHSLKSQVGRPIGSESDCLLGQLKRILEISDSVAGLKVEKSGGGAVGGEWVNVEKLE